MYFRYSGLRRTSLDICLKSPALGDPLTSNMVRGSKHFCYLKDSIVTISSDHLKVNDLENIHFSDMEKLIRLY